MFCTRLERFSLRAKQSRRVSSGGRGGNPYRIFKTPVLGTLFKLARAIPIAQRAEDPKAYDSALAAHEVRPDVLHAHVAGLLAAA